MDFFEYQEEARKRTRLLVFYYAMAVVLIIAAVYLALVFGVTYREAGRHPPSLWHPSLLLWTTVFVGGVIGIGTAFKVSSLASGGKSVARMMGGQLVAAETTEPDERRLLNIVEEMAIASGVPVPPVYLIDEAGINAFAAGFNPSDAVIGVTRGCLEHLDRDELQGVIAHEFSHILNGDMRLNIRLIGVLFGILLLTVIGTWLTRIAFYSGMTRHRTSRGGGKEGGARLAMMLFGVLLIAAGSIGVFFGRLIKSAISRQREFLSDASAVQFTRNPAGIGGALKKIGRLSSRLESFHAEEASHMFFANGVKSAFGGLLSTHPPIDERIRRIDPSLLRDGMTSSQPPRPAPAADAAASGFTAGVAVTDPADITSRIGTLDARGLDYASRIIAAIPEQLRMEARTSHGARAIVYCLLLSREKGAAEKQMAYMQQNLPKPTLKSVGVISRQIGDVPAAARLPLVELALPALQQLERVEYLQLKKIVKSLILTDSKVSIFELALSRNLVRHLEPVYGKPEKMPVTYRSIRPLLPQCLPLIAMLGRYGNEDNPQQAILDYTAGIEQLGCDPAATPMPETSGDPVETFAKALKVLQQADGKVKKKLVNACVAAVLGNRKVTVNEAELLRAVADSLDCPLPPIVVSDFTV